MTVYSKTVPDEKYRSLRDKFFTSLTADEFHAVEFYLSSGYKSINHYLMDASTVPDTNTSTSYDSIVSSIITALTRHNPDGSFPLLYRGARQQHVKHFNIGDEVSFPFFMSTTTDPVVASRFAGEEEPAVLIIKGVDGSCAPISLNSHENEVIISPSSRFTVQSITEGVSFQAEYDNSGFYAPARKNVTVIEITVL
jgi:hypothetical protein